MQYDHECWLMDHPGVHACHVEEDHGDSLSVYVDGHGRYIIARMQLIH